MDSEGGTKGPKTAFVNSSRDNLLSLSASFWLKVSRRSCLFRISKLIITILADSNSSREILESESPSYNLKDTTCKMATMKSTFYLFSNSSFCDS